MSIQQTPDSSTSARSEPDPAVRPAAPVTEANLAAHMARLDAMDRPATATTQADPRVHDRITLPRAVAAAAPTVSRPTLDCSFAKPSSGRSTDSCPTVARHHALESQRPRLAVVHRRAVRAVVAGRWSWEHRQPRSCPCQPAAYPAIVCVTPDPRHLVRDLRWPAGVVDARTDHEIPARRDACVTQDPRFAIHRTIDDEAVQFALLCGDRPDEQEFSLSLDDGVPAGYTFHRYAAGYDLAPTLYKEHLQYAQYDIYRDLYPAPPDSRTTEVVTKVDAYIRPTVMSVHAALLCTYPLLIPSLFLADFDDRF
nr:hypothetical protein CFP56_21814 [Quercus suber]